ncbi:hypothetical protein C0J52_26935 [Blattella germanica]|nr:hypothetical protein C0J52_26935 [Blattella germanica]
MFGEHEREVEALLRRPKSQLATLRVDKTGGAWCPKQQVERGVREYLEVDLGEVYVLTGVETQGRYDRGRGQEYAEEYTIEYWRPGLGDWRQYSRWDGKQTRTQETILETDLCKADSPGVDPGYLSR